MTIALIGRWSLDITYSVKSLGSLGNVFDPTTNTGTGVVTMTGPALAYDAQGRKTKTLGWPEGATTQELYDFDRWIDTAAAAAGVPEQNRQHPDLWGLRGDERDVKKQQLFARRPDLAASQNRQFFA